MQGRIKSYQYAAFLRGTTDILKNKQASPNKSWLIMIMAETKRPHYKWKSKEIQEFRMLPTGV